MSEETRITPSFVESAIGWILSDIDRARDELATGGEGRGEDDMTPRDRLAKAHAKLLEVRRFVAEQTALTEAELARVRAPLVELRGGGDRVQRDQEQPEGERDDRAPAVRSGACAPCVRALARGSGGRRRQASRATFYRAAPRWGYGDAY